MIIVDRALEKRASEGNLIRVGMVGAGFMGRAIALQISRTPGMRLVAIANRHIAEGWRAYLETGVPTEDIYEAESLSELESAIRTGKPVTTEDPLLLCQTDQIDAIIEVTGTVEYSARVVLAAIENHKHVIMMNAELDGTLGPILKVYADRAGVVISNADGDQPGVTMNLYRFVKGIGVTPVLCGNIKGLHDPYRNPATQKSFAERWGQNPSMVTSFADGTKISFEQAVIANATGMHVARRGMLGPIVPAGTLLKDAIKAFPLSDLLADPGWVDYLVGAEPAPGVFVLGTCADIRQQRYLDLYKLGQGPLYCFYTPYHLCHFEVPNTVARAVLFGDAAIAPKDGPCVEVVAVAKTSLVAGQALDGLGEYLTYGLAENSDVVHADGLLPIGLAMGCRLVRDIPRDRVLRFDDVVLPTGRLCDTLWAEQKAYFDQTSQILGDR